AWRRNTASRTSRWPRARSRSGCFSGLSLRACAAPHIQALERPLELVRHPRKRRIECRPPADEDIIMPGAKTRARQEPHHLTQPPPHPIALDRVADLARHREADADRSVVPARPRLQHKSRGRDLASCRRGQEIRPLPQALHGGSEKASADSRLRPRLRRAATTLRPPLVAMRARNP